MSFNELKAKRRAIFVLSVLQYLGFLNREFMTSILENCPGVLLLNTLNGGQCKENQTKTMNQGEKKVKCEQNWYIHVWD